MNGRVKNGIKGYLGIYQRVSFKWTVNVLRVDGMLKSV